MRDAAANVEGVAPAAVIDAVSAVARACCIRRSSRLTRASCSSISALTQQCASASARSDRIVSTNSECAPLNEWMKPPSGSGVQRARLHGAADFQRQLVEAHFPVGWPRCALRAPAATGAVGADVVEAVIVDADVGQMRRHALERARSAEIEELASPVASNCSSAEPNWNPCVHSVHPRA